MSLLDVMEENGIRVRMEEREQKLKEMRRTLDKYGIGCSPFEINTENFDSLRTAVRSGHYSYFKR